MKPVEGDGTVTRPGTPNAGQAPIVTPKKVAAQGVNSLGDIMDIIKKELGTNLRIDLQNEAVGLDAFLGKIEGDVNAAIASGDETSLSLISDRIRGHLLRRSLGEVSRQSDRAQMIVMTVLRTLIRAGVTLAVS